MKKNISGSASKKAVESISLVLKARHFTMRMLRKPEKLVSLVEDSFVRYY